MAEKFDPLAEVDVGFKPDALESLSAVQATKDALFDRSMVKDSALGILDTLQSLGSIPVAALPGYGLEDAAETSQWLDQFKSPAYKASQEIAHWDDDPNAGFLAAAGDALTDTLTNGNLLPDVVAQVPYLLMGPAGRLSGVARAEKAAGILGKVAKYTAGTNEAATINRIAALSGIMEGAGGYGATYQRALSEGASEEEAASQAMKAGAVNAALGAVLGRVTPAFELHPTGMRGTSIASHLAAIGGEAIVEEGGLAVGATAFDNYLAGKEIMQGTGAAFGEAAATAGAFTAGIRSPGMALDFAQQLGKDVKMAASAVGSAIAPVVKKAAQAVGKDVVTPEEAAINAADAANAAAIQKATIPPSSPVETAPVVPTEEETIRKQLVAQGLEGENLEKALRIELSQRSEQPPSSEANSEPTIVDEATAERQAIQSIEADADQRIADEEAAAERKAIQSVEAEADARIAKEEAADAKQNRIDARVERTAIQKVEREAEQRLAEQAAADVQQNKAEAKAERAAIQSVEREADKRLAKEDKAKQPKALPAVNTKSASQAVRTILVDAATDAVIESTTGDEQLAAIARKENIAPAVAKAREEVKKLSDKYIAQKVKEAAAGNEQAALVVQAVRRVDPTRLPDSAVSAQDKPVVDKLKEVKQSGVDKTSRQILSEGFDGRSDRKGVDQYLEETLGLSALGVDRPTDVTRDFIDFVEHLQIRANAFNEAMAKEGNSVAVEGTKTRNEKGHLTDKPFIIHKNSPASVAVKDRVLADAAQAQEALDVARKAYPEMFSAEAIAELEAEEKTERKRINAERKAAREKSKAEAAGKTEPEEKVKLEKTETQESSESASESKLIIEESPYSTYPERTKENADAADVTVAIAENFHTGGEKLTARVAGNKLIQIPFNMPFTDAAKLIVAKMKILGTSLNIAGNGIYTLAASGHTQNQVDNRVYQILAEVHKQLPITAIRSGGQTGVDEAGAKAGQRLGVPTTVLLPKGFRIRTAEGKDINQTREEATARLTPTETIIEEESTSEQSAEDAYFDAAASVRSEEEQGQVYEMSQREEQAAIDAAAVTEITVDKDAPFATFNEKNHFKEAFVPTGGGLLKRSFEDLLEVLKAGSEIEQKAAAHLERFVPYLRDEINKYVQKELNRPVSEKNSTTIKDELKNNPEAASYSSRIWANLLVETADDYALHPGIAEAAAVAALMQMTRGAFERTTMDADEDTDSLYFQWLNNIAKDSMRIFGVQGKTSESTTLEQGIPKSLALTVIGMLASNGKRPDKKDSDISISKVEIGNKTFKNITMNPNTVNVIREFPEFAEVMRKFLGDAYDDTVHYGAPPTEIKKTVRNSRQRIDESQETAIGNRQKVAHYRNIPFINVITALGDAYIRLRTGFAEISKDPQLEEISKSLIKGTESEFNALKRYSGGLDAHAAENNFSADEVAMYLSYEILANGRGYSGYTPQTKKLLRESFAVGKKTFDLTNENDLKILKLMIAQAIEPGVTNKNLSSKMKTDVNTHEEVIAALDAAIAEPSPKEGVPSLADKALALYLASTGEEVDGLDQMLERDAVYSDKELHGLMTLGQYLVNQKSTSFETMLSFEIDGKTNGAANAELLFGLHNVDDQSTKNFHQGGFFPGIPDQTIATMRDTTRTTYGSLDLYERVARNTPILRNEVLALAGYVSEENLVTRAGGKEAIVPLGYSSGKNSLIIGFATRIEGQLADKLRLAIKHGDKKQEASVRQLLLQNKNKIAELKEFIQGEWFQGKDEMIEQMARETEILSAAYDLGVGLYTSYLNEKPQVARTNKLMVRISSVHASIRSVLFAAKAADLRETKIQSGELSPQFELSRNDYNKVLKSLPSTTIPVPGAGAVTVAESANTGRSSTRIQGIGGETTELSVPEITNPGVSAVAMLTIAAGDAAMGNALFQKEEQVLDVHDGIEMSGDQIDAMGVKLNDASYTSLSDSVLDGFAPLLEWVSKNIAIPATDLGELIPSLKHPNAPRSVAQQKKIDHAKSVYGVKHDVALLAAINSLNELNVFKVFKQLRKDLGAKSNSAAIDKLEDELEYLSKGIKANRAKLDAQPSSYNQMAGGGIKYTTKPKTEPRTEPSTTKEFREGWNEQIEAGFDANNGQLDRSGVIALLDGHQWTNKVHRAIWNKLRNILPTALLISLAKNEEQWNELNKVGDNGITYGSVKGTSYAETGIVNLATADPVTMLHELVHQVITGNLNQYFSNINAVPTALRSPINDLQQLLNRFLSLPGKGDLALAQAFVHSLQAKGDTAAAIDEMIAHVLTNEDIIKELQPSLFTRIVNQVKRILSALFGTTATPKFMDEVLAAFNKLSAGPRMDVNKSVRTSPVLNKIFGAYQAIAQKIANGQIKAVPDLKDSHLDTLLNTYNLTPEQKGIYNQVWMLMRMNARSAALEKYSSTVLSKHPNADVFNGARDSVASVMALAAADDTFRAQADTIWKQNSKQTIDANNLIDMALEGAPLADSTALLNEALDTMRTENEQNLSLLGTVVKRLDRMGNEWMEKIGKKASDTAQDAPVGVAEILQGISALTSEEGAKAYGEMLMTLVNERPQLRALQDLVAALVGTQEETKETYRQLTKMKSTVAQTRSLFTINLPAQLKTLFPEGFEGWNHLYEHFGRIDAGVLGESAGEMFSDNAARAKAIKALESKVKNHWDAKNLASYMLTGKTMPKSTHALLRNARAIADDLNGKNKKASDSLVADVDQLVTLYAIDMLNKNDRARIAEYFKQHPKAMNNLTGMLQKVAHEESQQYREEHRYNYWKGALPLSTDPRTSIVVADLVKGAELEGLGYRREKRFQSSADDPVKDFFYYVRDNSPPPVFTQGIINTVQQTAMSINHTTAATISPDVGTMITNRKWVRSIKLNPAANSNLIPVHNFAGEIVGYERLLDRSFVKTLTKSNNTQLHTAIGRKLGRIVEERMAEDFNKAAVDIMVKQWEYGKAHGQEAQYENIASTTDKQTARAWEVVPAETKQALENAFGGAVMVRRDLLSNTVGYYKAGVLDFYTGNASVNEDTRRAFLGLAQMIAGPNSAKYLTTAELAIKEGVATAKDWIIVRSLSVLYNNAMSAMNQVLANGVPIKDLFSSYREGMRDIRAYARLQKEMIDLTVKIAGASPEEKKRLRTIQRGKEQAIKRLAIYPLIEAGELSDLPQGLEEAPDHSYLGDFSGWLNNHLRLIHPKTPAVLANIIIAKDTSIHNVFSKAIQAGDFLGKYAVYKHMIKSGKGQRNALDTIRDEFIAYGTNPGRFRGALEDFGLVWWSQFTLRAQKILLRRLRKNPFSFFLSTTWGSISNTDGPSDAFITERGWDSSTGMDNIINAPSAHIFAKMF